MTDGAGSGVQAGPAGFVRDRTTLLLYAALCVFGGLQTVPSLATPALRDELGYGYGLASAHLSLYAVGSVLAGLVGVALTRRTSRRTVLLAGLLGAATGSALLTAGQAPWATLGACLLAGGMGTLVIIAVQAGLADHHGEQRAVAFAESNVMASVGSTLTPLVVGGLAAATGSWRWGVLALVVVAVALVAGSRGTAVPDPSVVAEHGARRRLPTRARAGVGLVFCGVVLEWSVSFWGATYLRDEVGLARSTAVTAMSLFFGAMLAGRVSGALLARRHPPERLVAAALGVTGVGLLLSGLSTAAPAALVALVLLGLGVSVLFPLGLSLAVGAAPDAAAAVSSRCVTAGGTAILLGPLVIGRLADGVGLRAALLVLPVTALAAVPLLRATRAARVTRD